MGKITETEIAHFRLREPDEQDASVILGFISELAAYEKMTDDVIATEELIHKALFCDHSAEAVIAEYHEQPVGFALYFYNFSTFVGRTGLYLEDLYIRPEIRGKGFGKAILRYLSRVAKERGCGRMEWTCLDWNEPSIRFYKSIGAEPVDGWTIYRMTGDAIDAFTAE